MRLRVQNWMGSTVSVETYAGESGVGPVFAASVDVVCQVDPTIQMVRNANGEEVVSALTIHVADTDAAKFAPQSRLTVSGRKSTVLSNNGIEFSGQLVYAQVVCT